MTETKSVKALKKQLAAAIAMVVVAAIALGSSTYAWFVSNNTVTATTTNISAQSNSAYLVIQNAAARTVGNQGNVTGTNTDSTTSATASETFSPDTKLYPAPQNAAGQTERIMAAIRRLDTMPKRNRL